MFVIPSQASAERRWLAHLARAAAGAIHPGDPFDDELPFPAAAVSALARRHRLAPLIHQGLREGRIGDALPEVFAEDCRRAYLGALRKNVIALELGLRIRADLAAEGIAAAPLKGWALIEGPARIYPDPGVRPMDDLDLIVARDDWDRAGELLRRHDFAPIEGPLAARRAAGHELAFHRRLGGSDLFVELHWAWAGPESLMRSFGLSGERFLAELCRDADVEGTLAPSWLGNLVFCAVHAARHAFGRWIWLLDLHRLVECEPVDWNEVLAAARRYRVSRPLYAGLTASRELFRTSIPKEVLGELAPGAVRRRLLHRSLAASSPSAAERPARVAKLLLGESWWDVARTAAWAAAPGRAWYEKRGQLPPRSRRARKQQTRRPDPARNAPSGDTP